MQAFDWRLADPIEVASLYAAEAARWRDGLAWDTSAIWSIVEAGRRARTVAGAIARDADGQPAGWCFALRQGDTLQVGGFVARSEDAVASLLDVLTRSDDGRTARRWAWFGYFDAPGLPDLMAARGADPARYLYLKCPLAPNRHAPPAATPVRSWQPGDVRHVAGLLASAYASDANSRPFAPSGRMDEWREYASLLLGSAGCGIFEPQLSLVAGAADDTKPPDAIAIVTRLNPETAHLAQLAVRAETQAAGLGRAMLAHVKSRASAAGCTALTLLVHERNARARRLYAGAGFEEHAVFLSAAWDVAQPRTFSSDALATGGVSTRR